ncbi:circadian clock-controlled protein daywake [Schistocerca cancellata]|uniref:circadian clock-controlled protein daywake n=1 Tax=Schistocerca cancellata TaxID=274614 RepID=UPI0021189210|nr:circadian clock-controlled protein daywake [Schistocerca cancellata]
MEAIFLLLSALLLLVPIQSAPSNNIPPYVKQCRMGDPKIVDCFIEALHHTRPYLAKGIPEIEMPSVEPFRMDELSLSLTTGPNGYRVTLRDVDIYGASNFSVDRLRLGKNGAPFESRIRIPQLRINARYTSSGVLIILPASGNGTFQSTLGDIVAVVRGKVSTPTRDGRQYLHVDTLDVDLSIKTVRMAVKKVFNNNRILTEATNLFLRENGHEVLNAMMPQLRTKLAGVFMSIANQLLKHVPTDVFLLPAEHAAVKRRAAR